MSKGELACVYASLVLADDDVDVTADKINALLKAANVRFVEPYLPGLFANALQGKNVKDMLMNIGSAGGAPTGTAVAASVPTTTTAQAPAAAPDKKSDKPEKVESEGESDESMGFDLFG
ncbi:hypothetical protein P879_07811 [Paragonimus westermani]|uniref:Large ribosomal subunit protein P1 n=1 Tax=Paragonimus westermani TaxID=34504 RepID=A0A8T0DM26_9TREM|nr:hypothetical protein P879_07811 [Paragonimus westermani]